MFQTGIALSLKIWKGQDKVGAVALIPARGGSKRLPRKNIIEFLGKPVICYTIEAAIECNCFEHVVVSTEDKEIASIAEHYGAQVEIRTESLACDTATVVEVCVDYLEKARAQGAEYNILCVLYATAPLRSARDVQQVVDLLQPEKCDFSIAVTEYDMPPHQALMMLDNLSLEPMWPDLINVRTSEFERLCVDNGSTYAVSVPAFLESRSFYGPNLRGYYMPRSRSVDIDTREDYDLARYYAESVIR